MISAPPRQVILAFEASADQASAAVLTGDGKMCQQVHAARHGHAALITELARMVLEKTALSARDVTHVAAGRGPGSFTGIRVALAAAKGFALAAGAAGLGVSCLAAMAQAAREARPQLAERRIIASADTRRGSFFCQAFDPSGPADPAIIEVDSEMPAAIPDDWKGAVIVGPGAAAVASTAAGAGLTEAADLPGLDALQVARLAAHRIRADITAEPLTPLYVAPAFLGPPAR